MPRIMSIEEAANEIGDMILNRANVTDPSDRHMQGFAAGILSALGMTPSPAAINEAVALLKQADIAPDYVTEYPKMLTTTDKKGRVVPVTDPAGNPVIVHSKDEEDEFEGSETDFSPPQRKRADPEPGQSAPMIETATD